MAVKINNVSVEKGKAYTTKDLKFSPHEVRTGKVITKNGETVIFITIDYKYRNELHSDGVVHEPRNQKPLFDYGKIEEKEKETKIKTYLFVRHCHKGAYLYIGKMTCATHYDRDRNKLYIKNPPKKSSGTKKKIKGK